MRRKESNEVQLGGGRRSGDADQLPAPISHPRLVDNNIISYSEVTHGDGGLASSRRVAKYLHHIDFPVSKQTEKLIEINGGREPNGSSSFSDLDAVPLGLFSLCFILIIFMCFFASTMIIGRMRSSEVSLSLEIAK